MKYILYDGASRNNLLPFTYTRPVADIRVGIMSIREKWEFLLGVTTYSLTHSYLKDKYPHTGKQGSRVLIDASYIPGEKLAQSVQALQPGQILYDDDRIIATCMEEDFEKLEVSEYESVQYDGELTRLEHLWDIFILNAREIEEDFRRITAGRKSQPVPEGVWTVNKENIFIEEGAEVMPGVVLNASGGSIYLGKNSIVMEGAMIRGAFALGEHSQIKMGAKIYGGTTIGPQSKVGGEVNNSVFFGYANKAHDGFLGNSVIGEWCNLGAGTNNSNLKNNYASVKIWSYEQQRFEDTGLQFCGLFMGDHSKAGIDTMFNTGTVVGVSANVFGANFPRNFIPSFSWGGAAGMKTYQLAKALETAGIVMQRRNKELDDTERDILTYIFNETQKFRRS